VSAQAESALNQIRAAFEAYVEGGPQALLDRYDRLFGSEFEWHPALVGGLDGRTFVGSAAFADYWREIEATFDEFSFRDVVFEDLGDGAVLVTARVRSRGIASGVELDNEAAFVFVARNGLIISGQSFFSRADAEAFARA
jgi:ketosteroid isomerase-like protein